MTDAEKMAAELLPCECGGDEYHFEHAGMCRANYRPEVAAALRAARNEGLEEGAKTADELFGLGHHPVLISGALQAASAIRSMKDAGNG